jgi:hypothetical protein
MLVAGLAKAWQVDLYNEDNPAAFHKWFLRDLSVIQTLIDESFADVILFKPLKDTYRTPVLLSTLPLSRVLFMFRHYNDVTNSARKQFFDDRGYIIKSAFEDNRAPVARWIDTGFEEFSDAPPPKETEELIMSLWTPSLNLESIIALEWLFTNQLYFDLGLAEDGRVKLVQYEAVVADPVQEFRSVCQFLGVPFEPRIAEGIFSSSVSRDPAPDIDPDIQVSCDALWQRLCHHFSA